MGRPRPLSTRPRPSSTGPRRASTGAGNRTPNVSPRRLRRRTRRWSRRSRRSRVAIERTPRAIPHAGLAPARVPVPDPASFSLSFSLSFSAPVSVPVPGPIPSRTSVPVPVSGSASRRRGPPRVEPDVAPIPIPVPVSIPVSVPVPDSVSPRRQRPRSRRRSWSGGSPRRDERRGGPSRGDEREGRWIVAPSPRRRRERRRRRRRARARDRPRDRLRMRVVRAGRVPASRVSRVVRRGVLSHVVRRQIPPRRALRAEPFRTASFPTRRRRRYLRYPVSEVSGIRRRRTSRELPRALLPSFATVSPPAPRRVRMRTVGTLDRVLAVRFRGGNLAVRFRGGNLAVRFRRPRRPLSRPVFSFSASLRPFRRATSRPEGDSDGEGDAFDPDAAVSRFGRTTRAFVGEGCRVDFERAPPAPFASLGFLGFPGSTGSGSTGSASVFASVSRSRASFAFVVSSSDASTARRKSSSSSSSPEGSNARNPFRRSNLRHRAIVRRRTPRPRSAERADVSDPPPSNRTPPYRARGRFAALGRVGGCVHVLALPLPLRRLSSRVPPLPASPGTSPRTRAA